jgi:hypothetical protein
MSFVLVVAVGGLYVLLVSFLVAKKMITHVGSDRPAP